MKAGWIPFYPEFSVAPGRERNGDLGGEGDYSALEYACPSLFCHCNHRTDHRLRKDSLKSLKQFDYPLFAVESLLLSFPTTDTQFNSPSRYSFFLFKNSTSPPVLLWGGMGSSLPFFFPFWVLYVSNSPTLF